MNSNPQFEDDTIRPGGNKIEEFVEEEVIGHIVDLEQTKQSQIVSALLLIDSITTICSFFY